MGSIKPALILLVCMNIAYVNCRRGKNRMSCCETARWHGDRNFNEELIECCEKKFMNCGISKMDIESAAITISPDNCETWDWMGTIRRRCIDNMKYQAREKISSCCYEVRTEEQFSECVGLYPEYSRRDRSSSSSEEYSREDRSSSSNQKFDGREYRGLSHMIIRSEEFNEIYQQYLSMRTCEAAIIKVDRLIEEMYNMERTDYSNNGRYSGSKRRY